MAENVYQRGLIRRIRTVVLPGCIALKNDSGYQQGFPDWTVYYGPRYAILEVKDHEGAREEPNQRWFIEQFQSWGVFAEFIYPENEEEVLHALQRSLAA